MRGVGWVVFEACSDGMVEGMTMDPIYKTHLYISILKKESSAKSYLKKILQKISKSLSGMTCCLMK